MTQGRSFDIAVMGAGPAGVAAATAGSAAGAKVLLVDVAKRLGGTVTAGLHRSLCGLYADEPKDPWDTLNEGVQQNVVQRLARQDREHVCVRQYGKVWVLEFATPVWETVLAELCGSPGLEVRLQTRLTGVDQEDSRLTAVRLEGAGPDDARAGVFLDCTGDGVLIRMAGAELADSRQEGERPCLAGYAVRVTGLTDDLEKLRLQIPFTLTRAVAAEKLPPEARFTMFHPGPMLGEGVCKLAIPLALGGANEAASGDGDGSLNPLLNAYVDDIVGCLRQEIIACRDARIVERSPRPLPRNGGRLRGRYTVTRDDVLGGSRGAAPGVRAWWPIETWDADGGPAYVYPPVGKAYTIPDEALQSDRFDNLLAAGACVSASRDARASLRAGGICLATGDAAGRLAAMV